MMNINKVNQRIKQRPPFQMIERVLEIIPNESATGLKNIAINEPYFMGHFPESPIMPGVLITEACAQLSSIVMDDSNVSEDVLYVLLKIDNFKFIKPVIPGDQLIITVTKSKVTGPLVSFDCKVKVNDKIYAKGSLTFTAVNKDTIYGE